LTFDVKKHLIKVQGGKEYLPVAKRLVWMREEHPDWAVITEAVEINLVEKYAVFRATIMDENGKTIGTGTKYENASGFCDYIEKAETGSIGRALAVCGYGTQFAPELEEGDRLADSPQPNGNGSPAQEKAYNPNAITEAQVKKIHAMASDIWGKTKDSVTLYKQWLKSETGKESSSELTKAEAKEVIDKLQVLIEEKEAA